MHSLYMWLHNVLIIGEFLYIPTIQINIDRLSITYTLLLSYYFSNLILHMHTMQMSLSVSSSRFIMMHLWPISLGKNYFCGGVLTVDYIQKTCQILIRILWRGNRWRDNKWKKITSELDNIKSPKERHAVTFRINIIDLNSKPNFSVLLQ
jgi:hypothetical protein